MIIKLYLSIGFLFCCNSIYSQQMTSKDADGNIWLITDSITSSMLYIKENKRVLNVSKDNEQLLINWEKFDTTVVAEQYALWSSTKNYVDFEPYAAMVFAVLFSKKMKIIDIRILRREAYDKNKRIDNIVKKAIKNTLKTKGVRNSSLKNSKERIIIIGRARVVMPN